MSSVQIQELRKSYGATEIIHGVSIDIEDGEFVVLLGPSGCGKSTLLRMISGLETITDGEIYIGDRLVNRLEPKNRDIAMVFQNYALYPQMTVAQNIGFPLEMDRIKKDEINRQVNEAAETLGLQPFLKHYPRQLSGGQRQRVAMGRAIVRHPSVFLFDEPLSNLDAKLRVQMRAEIKSLQQKLNTTTVYVTHDQVEAMTMADKIVVLKEGRIEQVGTPLDLYDKPANMFVAGFMGSPAMNLLEGTIRAGDKPVLELNDGMNIGLGTAPPQSDGQRMVVGVRPEEVSIGTGDRATARVLVVEPTGSETQVTMEYDGREIVCASRERVSLQPGDMSPISFEGSTLCFFDPDTAELLNVD